MELDTPVTWNQLTQLVARPNEPVSLSADRQQVMVASHSVLAKLIGERRRIYGATTGYGPLANTWLSPDHGAELQRNLVYHLASGVGPPLRPDVARAVMLARVISLSKGYSGVSPRVVNAMLAWINAGLTPWIPSQGTVGASGDLTPLSHMALALIGEGYVLDQGQKRPSAEALEQLGLPTLKLEGKDGLSLVNGTSVTAGISLIVARRLEGLFWLSMSMVTLYLQVMRAQSEAFDPFLGLARPFKGQQTLTRWLNRVWVGTSVATPAEHPPPVLPDEARGHAPVPHQDPYSMRCVPQLYGAILDALNRFRDDVVTEINSVSDNPLVDPLRETVVHGGNFFGQHLGFAADSMLGPLVQWANHLERVSTTLCDPALSRGLPTFLLSSEPGLNSGFMGAQVTASAILAEMRSLAQPVTSEAAMTNNANQDVVPLATIAARRIDDLTNHLESLTSIVSIMLAQAVDLAEGLEWQKLCLPARMVYETVREHVAPLQVDRPLAPDIERMTGVWRTSSAASWPHVNEL